MRNGSGSFGTCSGCGKRVVWIKTVNGKNMPCDPNIVNYALDPKGKEKIVTPTGKVVCGTTGAEPGESGWVWLYFPFCYMPQSERLPEENELIFFRGG